MIKNLISFLCGGMFAFGLMLSGMSNPNIVLSFFDIFGQWNPQLIFVMLGAILIAILPFQFAKKTQQNTFFNQVIQLPSNNNIDSKLILGSILFGIGWGLSGICPAPAFTLLGLQQWNILFFIVPILLTMWFYERI